MRMDMHMGIGIGEHIGMVTAGKHIGMATALVTSLVVVLILAVALITNIVTIGYGHGLIL